MRQQFLIVSAIITALLFLCVGRPFAAVGVTEHERLELGLISRERWSAAKALAKTHMARNPRTWLFWEPLHGVLGNMPPAGSSRYLTTRATLLAIAGQYDAAIADYLPAIDAAIATGETNDTEMARAVLRATRCAVKLGDYPRAAACAARLARLRQSDVDATLAGILANLAKEPDNPACRLALADTTFFRYPDPVLGGGFDEEIRFVQDALAMKPARDAQCALSFLLAGLARSNFDYPLAINTYRGITHAFAGEDAEARALLEAEELYRVIDRPRGKAMLVRVVEHWPATYRAAQAHARLADHARWAKDEAGWLAELKKTAAGAAPPPAGETRDIRLWAHTQLGDFYYRRKDFARAVEYYRVWQPQRTGGNGDESEMVTHDLRIAECLQALGKSEQALKEYLLPWLTRETLLNGADERLVNVVVELYLRRKESDQLQAVIYPLLAANPTRYPNARAAARELQYRTWLQQKAYGKLIDALLPVEWQGTWTLDNLDYLGDRLANQLAAAQALVSANGDEFPAIRQRYAALSAAAVPGEPSPTAGHRVLLLYAIARSHAPAATALLHEIQQQIDAAEKLPPGEARTQALAAIGVSGTVVREAIKMRE